MKAGWVTKKLSELCTVFADGDWIESKDQAPEGLRLIQTGNVGEGVFKDREDKARYISEATLERLRCTEIFEGDCLVSRLPDPVGRSCILPNVNERMITAVDCTIIRFDVTRIRPDFFNYYSQSSEYLTAIDAETTGTTRKRISRSKLANALIPLPPLPEQQRIVAILDDAFEAIAPARANAEQNRLNAHALFESYLQAVFSQCGEGWVETTIGTVIKFIDYRGKTPVKTESGVRLITAKNVKMGYLNVNPMEFIAASWYSDWMTRGIPKKGDVLFTTEAPLANVAQLDTEERVAFAQRVIIMQTNRVKLDSTFLKFMLLSQPVQQRIRAKGTGATVQGIKASLLKLIEISSPNSLTTQEQIVSKLNALESETQRLESLYKRKIAALDELKQSLLQQAFSGQL